MKDRSNQDRYDSAEAYLRAVVTGETAPDAVRVQAARVLIQYEAAKARLPVASPSKARLHEKALKASERAIIEDFEAKAAEVRLRHAAKRGGNHDGR